MKVMLLITSDQASIDRSTGKLNILGAFGRIIAKEFPVVHQRMALAVKLRAELGDHRDQRIIAVELVDEDGTKYMKVQGPFSFPRSIEGEEPETVMVLELNNVPFPHSGFYQFIIYVDDERVDDTTIHLVQSTQPME